MWIKISREMTLRLDMTVEDKLIEKIFRLKSFLPTLNICLRLWMFSHFKEINMTATNIKHPSTCILKERDKYLLNKILKRYSFVSRYYEMILFLFLEENCWNSSWEKSGISFLFVRSFWILMKKICRLVYLTCTFRKS